MCDDIDDMDNQRRHIESARDCPLVTSGDKTDRLQHMDQPRRHRGGGGGLRQSHLLTSSREGNMALSPS